jgi:hypothetical protein
MKNNSAKPITLWSLTFIHDGGTMAIHVAWQQCVKRPHQRRIRVPKYTKWNPIIPKDIEDYSAMKSYLKKDNLFYLLPKFRKAYKGSN